MTLCGRAQNDDARLDLRQHVPCKMPSDRDHDSCCETGDVELVNLAGALPASKLSVALDPDRLDDRCQAGQLVLDQALKLVRT